MNKLMKYWSYKHAKLRKPQPRFYQNAQLLVWVTSMPLSFKNILVCSTEDVISIQIHSHLTLKDFSK